MSTPGHHGMALATHLGGRPDLLRQRVSRDPDTMWVVLRPEEITRREIAAR